MTTPSTPPAEGRHPIGFVARKTGLKPDLIRTWERRYGAVQPQRTATQRRLYSDSDIERLHLLREAVSQGHRIGQLAELPDAEIAALIRLPPHREAPGDGARGPRASAAPTHGVASALPLESSLEAILNLDAETLGYELEKASMHLGRIELLDHFLTPLMTLVGDLYYRGELSVAHEHLASAAVRAFVGHLRPAFPPSLGAPGVVVATPLGQHHEIGALLVAATAKSEGWRVTYLGSNLPAEEIAKAALETRAGAVALSITHPPDDRELPVELRRLKRLLPSGTRLLTGGQATFGYRAVLDEVGARNLPDLDSLRRQLERLRGFPADG